MPRTTRTRAPRRGQTARNGLGEVVAPCACLHCDGDLTMLAPVLRTSLDVLHVVVRNALDDRQTTARDVAAALRVSPERAATVLRRACDDGLLTRTKLHLPHGGYMFLYWVDPRAIAYIRQQSLRQEMRDKLFRPRASSAASAG